MPIARTSCKTQGPRSPVAMWTWAAEAGGGAEVWLLGNPGFSFRLQGEQGPCTSSHAGQVGIVPELRLQATSAAA